MIAQTHTDCTIDELESAGWNTWDGGADYLVEPQLVPRRRYRSSWILIVGGGILQVPAVEAAHELGFKVVVTDRDPGCACAELADGFFVIDTFNVGWHINIARDWPEGFAAVFTAGADPIVTVARAAEAAGCHGAPAGIAEMCAYKYRTRDILDNCRVSQPEYRLIANSDMVFCSDVDDWIANRAIIVKATEGSGSRGHTIINQGKARAHTVTAYFKAKEYSPSGVVLIEELLTGRELSVETLWYDGIMIPLNAVERLFIEDSPYAIELGHYNPAVLTPKEYQGAWTIMQQTGEAIGMDGTDGGHILKGDLMLTDDGPKVLELTTRLSGGFDSGWTSPLAHGTNYTKGALRLALGEPLALAMPDFTKRWYGHSVCKAVFGPPEGGVIKSITVPRDVYDFGKVVLRFKPGDTLPPLEDCSSRVVFCIADGYPAYDAGQAVENMASMIKVEME